MLAVGHLRVSHFYLALEAANSFLQDTATLLIPCAEVCLVLWVRSFWLHQSLQPQCHDQGTSSRNAGAASTCLRLPSWLAWESCTCPVAVDLALHCWSSGHALTERGPMRVGSYTHMTTPLSTHAPAYYLPAVGLSLEMHRPSGSGQHTHTACPRLHAHAGSILDQTNSASETRCPKTTAVLPQHTNK